VALSSHLPIVFGQELLGVVLVHDLDEINYLVAVAELIVIPAADLYEGIGQVNTCGSIVDRGQRAIKEVAGNDCILGVSENTLEVGLGGLLHRGINLLLGSRLLEVDSKVNDGNIEGRYTHRNSGKLAVELRDYLANSLCGASGRRDDVAGSGTSAPPVLSTLGRTINGQLGSGGRVNGGHETGLDAEVVIENLGDRSEAVGGARCVGNDLLALVGIGVDTAYEHVSLTTVFTLLGRSGENYILSACLEMLLGTIHGQIETGGLNDVLGAYLSPLDVLCIPLSEDADILSVYNESVIILYGNLTVETAVHGIILKKISEIVNRKKVVDRNYFYIILVGLLESGAEDETADTTESVNTNFNHCSL